MAPEASGPWSGKILGKYEIGPLVGRGGMADVYRGRHTDLERDVAVKLIHPHLTVREGFVDRFRREGISLAKLRHPHIVQVYDSGNNFDIYYLVMEYIDGPTLAELLKTLHDQGEAYALREAVSLLLTLSGALGYAHRENMVHRDVKPGNVIFTSRGQAILTDFGLVKMVGSTLNTVSGTVLGSPMYMSPEQGSGKPGDGRGDLYSLGVMLFELVTGQPPFEGDTPFSIIMKQVNEPLPAARSFNPSLPEIVDDVIAKATVKDPAGRYQSSDEFASGLQGILVELDAQAAGAAVQTLPPAGPAPLPASAEARISLDFLTGVLVQILGPVGSIMDWARIVRGMGEDSQAFPVGRIPEVLDRLTTQYRVSDADKRTQIRRLVDQQL
jgi:serine/threonine protein kinase